MVTREDLAAQLIGLELPERCRAHQATVAAAIARGDSKEALLGMPEARKWPETFHWLGTLLADLSD